MAQLTTSFSGEDRKMKKNMMLIIGLGIVAYFMYKDKQETEQLLKQLVTHSPILSPRLPGHQPDGSLIGV